MLQKTCLEGIAYVNDLVLSLACLTAYPGVLSSRKSGKPQLPCLLIKTKQKHCEVTHFRYVSQGSALNQRFQILISFNKGLASYLS